MVVIMGVDIKMTEGGNRNYPLQALFYKKGLTRLKRYNARIMAIIKV